MSTVFTCPGKLGDAIHQWPVAFWWHREHQEPYEAWLDEKTCKPLVSLIAAQPGCSAVILKAGIESYHCGGQPWNFGLNGTLVGPLQCLHGPPLWSSRTLVSVLGAAVGRGLGGGDNEEGVSTRPPLSP